MLVFLLLYCFIFSNTLAMQFIPKPDNVGERQKIYFFDHDNENVKPFGEENSTRFQISGNVKTKIGLGVLSLWVKNVSNYRIEIGTVDKPIDCLPAYPSCQNLINYLERSSVDNPEKENMIRYLKKAQYCEKNLFFFQIRSFRKYNLYCIHNALINNKIDPFEEDYYIKQIKDKAIYIYNLLIGSCILLTLVSGLNILRGSKSLTDPFLLFSSILFCNSAIKYLKAVNSELVC